MVYFNHYVISDDIHVQTAFALQLLEAHLKRKTEQEFLTFFEVQCKFLQSDEISCRTQNIFCCIINRMNLMIHWPK